jgi:hypothetical protein
MNRIKLLIATAAVVAATVFGMGSQVLTAQQMGAPVVGSLCCFRP